MRTYLLALLLLPFLARGAVVAQVPEITAPNAIIAELGGRGGLYTVTYERLLSPRNAVSAGVMVLPIDYSSATLVAVPLGYAFSFTATDARFFIDAGVTSAVVVNRYGEMEGALIPSLGLGLQYRPYVSSGLFKFEFLVADMSWFGERAWPWGGIGGGHTF